MGCKGLYSEKGDYVPKAGDVMIQKNGRSHTGIVEKVDAEGSFEFSWVTSSWGEWDEEKQEWINIDVEHTFE